MFYYKLFSSFILVNYIITFLFVIKRRKIENKNSYNKNSSTSIRDSGSFNFCPGDYPGQKL